MLKVIDVTQEHNIVLLYKLVIKLDNSINSNRSMRLINNSNSISLKSYSSRSNLFFTWQVKVLELKVQ